jgi:hypothetical protein
MLILSTKTSTRTLYPITSLKINLNRAKIISIGKEAEKKELLYIVDGSINLHSHYDKKYGDSSKT